MFENKENNGKISVVVGSTAFYGFRFNIKDCPKFDFDNYLLNHEEAEKLYNCRIVTINMELGEFAVAIKDCHSFQVTCPPQFLISKKFNVREIDDDDIQSMKRFCEFFEVDFGAPDWRHATTFVAVPEEFNKKTVRRLNDLEFNF